MRRSLLSALSLHPVSAVLVVVIAGLGLCAGGCGGSSPAASTRVGAAVDYAHCLRANGVPNWPDPSGSGVFDKSQLTLQRLGVSSSRLEAAQTACRHLLPNGGNAPTSAQVLQVKAQALRFSECVRAHGVPSFPDPGGDGRIPDPATVGIDQGSPKYEAANQACGRYRPPYMPSNAGYNAYAGRHAG